MVGLTFPNNYGRIITEKLYLYNLNFWEVSVKIVYWFLFAIIVVALLFFFSPVQMGIGMALAVVLLRICSVTVEPKTKVLVTNIFGGLRQAGPGWVLLFRPFEWIATVNESQIHSVQNRVLDVKLDVEAENEEFVTLDISVIYRITDLARYLDLASEDFKESVKEYTKSFATDIGRGCKDLDEIYEKIKDDAFEASLLAGFREPMPSGDITVEGHHGIQVVSVIISDPELSPALKAAAQEEQVAEKRAKAQNQEMLGVKCMAQRMVAQAKRNGKEMSLDRAMYLVQRQFDKVASVEEFGLSPDTLETIEKTPQAALPIWFSALLNRFSKATSGKRSRGPGNKGRGNGGKP